MDDYDPACPTEDDIQFADIDLSQVPLPPSFPAHDEGSGRDTAALPPGSPSELAREDNKRGRRKKKRRRKHGGARSPPAEEEEDKEDCDVGEQSLVTKLPAEPLPKEDNDEKPITKTTKAAESDNASDVFLTTQHLPASTLPQPPHDSTTTSAGSASVSSSNSSTAVSKQGKLLFKLTQDPSGGKAKVSFQLKKSVKSTFHATEEKEDEGGVVAEEVKAIVEKTAAGEYIPTRFKVSKKHDMFKPSLVEPSITVVFSPPLKTTTGTSNSSIIADTSIAPEVVAKSHDSDSFVESEATEVGDLKKERSTRSGKETRDRSKQDVLEESKKNEDSPDYRRGLRRSERMDRKKESNEGKEDTSRSTRRNSKGDDRDGGRYESSRSSYSRRDRDEDRQKDKEDKSRKTEISENDDRRRSARFRKNDSETKTEEMDSSNYKQEDIGRRSSQRKSNRVEQNASPASPRGRKTRNSHRSKSPSREKDDVSLASAVQASESPVVPECLKSTAAMPDLVVDASLASNEDVKSIANEMPNITSIEEQEALMETFYEPAGSPPHIEKIVIRRSVDSDDFEIAKSEVGSNVNYEQSSVKSNSAAGVETTGSLLHVTGDETTDVVKKEVDETTDAVEKPVSSLSSVNDTGFCDEKVDVPRKGKCDSPETGGRQSPDLKIDVTEIGKDSLIRDDEKFDVFEKDKGSSTTVDEKLIPDEKIDVLEKVRGISSKVDEKLKSDEEIDVFRKGKGSMTRVDEKLTFDDKIDVFEKGKSGCSTAEDNRYSDDKRDEPEKEKHGSLIGGEKRVDEMDVFEKGKRRTTKIDEKRFSKDKIDEKQFSRHKVDEKKYSKDKIDEKRYSKEKIDALGKGKRSTTKEDDKRFYKDKTEDVFDKRKYNSNRSDDKRFSVKEKLKSSVQQTYKKGRESYRSSSSSEDDDSQWRITSKEPVAAKLRLRSRHNRVPPPLPEQVLVDVSALPGKSKWEMDDEDDDETLEDNITRSEDRLPVKDVRGTDLSRRWQSHTQADSVQRPTQRMYKFAESSSNEEEKVHEHKRHKQKKRDNADKKIKKKRKEEDDVEGRKISEEVEEHKGRGTSSRNKNVLDNSKIVNYLRDYSTKDDMTFKVKSEIDSSKLVMYLKEYSGKMTAESSKQASSDSEVTIEKDAIPQKRRAKEESPRTTEDNTIGASLSEDLVSQRNENSLQTEDVSHKQKELGSSDLKVHYAETAKTNRREADEKLEHHDLKDIFELSCSRSSSQEKIQQDTSSERLKEQEEGPSAIKKKRARSSSAEVSETSASRSSQKSRDKRDRSGSPERNRRSKRNRSPSSEKQDQSRSKERKRGRRKSRSRSPAWRSRDRRNRSRSISQDRRNDRRNKSRSKERSSSYKSYRSPMPDSFGRTRRDNRDKRRRSRSGSCEKPIDTRKRDSDDGSSRSSRVFQRKSKSPDKKASETSVSGKQLDRKRGSAEKSKKINQEPADSVDIDISSIPIPNEIPLPGESDQICVPGKKQEVHASPAVASSDKLQDEGMEFSDEESEIMKTKSQARDDAEVSVEKLLSAPDALKAKTETKSEQKNQNVNLATLSSGKDRQIKFSITGSGRKLKPAVMPDVLGDGDANAVTEKDITDTLIVADTVDSESDKSALATQKTKKIEEDSDKREDLETEIEESQRKDNTEESQRKGNMEESQRKGIMEESQRKSSMEESQRKGNTEENYELDDSTAVDSHNIGNSALISDSPEKTDFPDKVELPHKVSSDNDNEKEMKESSPQPQRLKFKYTPLWELEKDDIKPTTVGIIKETKAGFGLALDYGSESSEFEDEEDSPAKKEVFKKEEKDSAVDKPKGAVTLTAADDSGSDEGKDTEAESSESSEDLATKENILLLGEQQTIKAEIISQPPVQTLPEAKEEWLHSEATEPPSQKHDSSLMPTEATKEAYSPSHPSMEEDLEEDLINVPASGSKDREALSNLDKPSPTLDGKVSGNTASPGTSGPQEGKTCALVSFVSSTISTTYGNQPVSSSNQQSFAQQMMQTSINPLETTAAARLISVVGQPALGLHLPLSHPSLHVPRLSIPQPVPPPSTVSGIQLPSLPFPQMTPVPKPVPPPPQLSTILSQVTLPFGMAGLTSSLTAAPPKLPSAQSINTQLFGVQGMFGLQGVALSGTRGIAPGTAQEVSLGAPQDGALPSLGTLSGNSLPSVEAGQDGILPTMPAASQSMPSSLATGGQETIAETVVDTPVKFRINRFHQGPSLAQAIPPPTVAIPTLTFPSVLGAPAGTLANIPASVPFISTLPSVSAATEEAPVLAKSTDSKQPHTSQVSSQKPHVALHQPVSSTTHSKRPKISSILSQPKIKDHSALESVGLHDIKAKSLTAASEGLDEIPVKSQPLVAHDNNLALPKPASPCTLEKQTELASDSTIEKTKSELAKSISDSLVEHQEVCDDTPIESAQLPSTVAKKDCSVEPTKPLSQPQEEITMPSVIATSHSLEEPMPQEQVSSSVQALEMDMDDIPLPGESPQASSAISFQASGKHDVHLPPTSSTKPSPPPVPTCDSSSTPLPNAEIMTPKGHGLGSLLAERKKRFSQSPLAIGMLPKIQVTQSPLAAGPLPKLPPEPDADINSVVPLKKNTSSPVVTDVKPIQISLSAKQKKPQVEKEETKTTPKVHFVFKSKAVVQKTLIPAFDDDGSDDSAGENQAASNEASHFENSILSLFAEDRKEAPLPVKGTSSAAVSETGKQTLVNDKETKSKQCDVGIEKKQKTVSLTDIEAFPVQVITSTRKEEVTPSSSWPEFTVGKKERRDEELVRDGHRRSHDRDDKNRKKSGRFSHERDRDERRRRSRYEGEDDRKINTRKKEDRRSDDEEEDGDYDGSLVIKQEKEDYVERQSTGQDGGQQRSRHYDEGDDRRRSRDNKDSDSYGKRRSRFEDENEYRRGKGKDTKEEKYSRRRGDDRDDDYSRRKYDNDDGRRTRNYERDRSRDRSRERGRSHERDRSSGKSSGKRSRRSRDKSRSRSRSRSPSRRRERGRDRSHDRYDRDKSRSHSRERGMSSSSRRKDLKSFKEELLEELTKPSGKADPKDDLFKAAAISSTSQPYSFDYQVEPVYSIPPDNNIYSQSHHGQELSSSYHGQDTNMASQYPAPSYDHQQQYDPQWTGQPVPSMYNQALPPQHQDIPSQYTPLPPEQMAASHQYPFQPPGSHYPQPGYPSNQAFAEPYHPVPSILNQHQNQQQLPQMHHQITGPQPTHILLDQHGQPIPPGYPAPQHQLAALPYVHPGPPVHFQPRSFTQEGPPPFTPPDFHLNSGPRPRAPLLPNPIRGPLLRPPLHPHNVEIPSFGSPRFSSPEAVSSPGLQKQPDIRPPKKSRFTPLDEGTFSPVIKSSLATSSSPTVGSPSTSTMSTSDAVYAKSIKADGLSNLPEPSFETSLLAESEFDSVNLQEAKKSSKVYMPKKKNSLEVNEPIVSSSGVEDSTGDTGSDSGTDSSSQRPLKVKSRWRRNSEAEAVVDTSTPPAPVAKQPPGRISTPTDTPDSSPKERRRTRSRAAAEEFNSLTAPLTETPPPPPPPRKRIKMESETVGILEEQENDVGQIPQEEVSKDAEEEAQDLSSLMARPDFPRFEIITENIHLTERKRSKSLKRMLCDCTTSREERSKGLPACGSDCLNKMLMIECNSRCPCGDHCTNKRFQKKQYSRARPFKAGDKGWGLVADEDIEEKGTFIMEYVGELLDYEEFVRRTRQYSKAGLVHHYFMALNADEVVDATLKGSISRFINHSCDPNCETQKWTVNGELRVGFFTRKSVKKGEELTFDYQFEHYGEAQKCYCGAENCRGYIGYVKSPTRNNRRKEKKKKELFKDELLEEDIAKLSLLDGMRNKNHVLDLCRLMVRAEKGQHRMAILKILQDTAEGACLRLFLDYHGLPLLWSWMADIGTTDYSAQTQELKLLMLSVLKSLPITNKTALKESKIPDMVDRWAVAAVVAARKPPPPPPPTSTAIVSMATTETDSTSSRNTVADNEAVASVEATTSDDGAAIEEDTDKATAAEPEATTSSESSPPASPSPLLPPLLSTITPVSILASAKDSKDAKRKRRVTFAEIPVESTFSPEPLAEGEENDDISSSTQSTGDKEGSDGDAAANRLLKDKRFGADEGKVLKFGLKPDDCLPGNIADSTSQKYNFDNGGNSGTASDTDNSDTETLIKDPLASLAAECVSLWSSLKEVFKIPKRERVEERKRTERELDVLSKKDLETSDPFAKWKRSKVMRLSKKKTLDDDERKLGGAPKMSKEERRQLFEAQVKAEDEMAAQAYAEEYQRQQEAYILHQQRLLEDPQYFYFHQQHQGDPNFAGMDSSMIPPEGLTDPVTGQPIPSETLIDPHTGQPILDPNTGQTVIDPNTGQPMIDQNTGQPIVIHQTQIDPNTGQPLLHPHHIDPQIGQPIQHIDPLTGQLIQLDPMTGHPVHQINQLTDQPVNSQIDPATGQPIQLQMDPLLTHQHVQSIHTHFDPHLGQTVQHQHSVLSQIPPSNFQHQPPVQHLPPPAQNISLLEIDFEEEVPPPPSPPTVPVTKLPPNWKTAKDSEGRVYYYHAFTRQTQWEMPSWEENDDDSDDMDLDPIPMDDVIKIKKKTTTAAADTSSEVARKIKDHFRSKMSNFIVTYLNPYRKQDCKIGRIVSTEDFKHLARKLTHHVMSKELKHCRHVEDLEVNENVKAKAKDYVRKYMSKFGSTFKKSSSPHPDEATL